MDRGMAISMGGHAVLIAIALFGLPWFSDDNRQPMQISEVSIMSASEFEALRSSAPQAPEIDANLTQPSVEFDPNSAPAEDSRPVATAKDEVEAPTEQDVAANLDAVTTRVVDPTVQTAVAEPETSAPQVSTLTAPSTGLDTQSLSPQAPVALNRPPAPRPADVISPIPNPAPTRPAEPSPREVASVQPDEAAETPETPPEPEAAPEETTTEVSPEQPSGEEDGARLLTAARPQARPQDLAEQVEAAARAAEEEAERQRQAEADAQAAEVAAALAAASEAPSTPAPAAQPDLPTGPPITAGERNAFFSQISACWVFDPGTENAADLIVTIEFDLNADGTVKGKPRQVGGNQTPASRRAFDAASRAVMRCSAQNGGYSLPAEKYGRWQKARITFDPSKRVLNW